jgi:hypothetical protein
MLVQVPADIRYLVSKGLSVVAVEPAEELLVLAKPKYG